MARRQGATVASVSTPAGTAFSLAQLEAAITEHKPHLVFVTHGESSTGVVQVRSLVLYVDIYTMC